MQKIYVAILLVLLLGISISLSAQTFVDASDYGARPGSRLNAVQAVQQALEACRGQERAVLRFAPGRYDFWPQHAVEQVYFESNTTDSNPKRCAIFISHFENLTLDGQGSVFVFHDRIQPFTVDSSAGITIRNCSIDWDIPLTAEAVVAAVADDFIDIVIDDRQFPYVIEEGRLVFVGEGWKSAWRSVMEFDGESLQVAFDTGDKGALGSGWRDAYRAEALAPGVVRLHNDFKRKPAVGNVLVLRHSARDHAGLFFTDSRDVTVEDVTLHHCAGLGVLAQYTENITLRRYHTIPAPGRKVVSGHDDGAQISNCRGHVLVEGCNFHGLMDDPINCHGTSVRIIEKVDDRTLRCRFMHDQATGMHWGHPGDVVAFIENQSMATVGECTVNKFRPVSRDTFELIFDAAIPQNVKAGHALENLTWSPDLTVRDCYFMSNRARGLLVSTPGCVVIEDNRFASSGSAILIAGDANYWYESGAVRDVLIKGNVFESACMTSMYQFCEGIVSIYPIIPKPDLEKPFHRNIRIVGNTFHCYDYPVLYALSVDGLTFSGNRLVRSHDFKPFHKRRATVTLEACRQVTIERNRLEGDVLGRNIVFEKTPQSEVTLGENQGLHME